MLDSESNVVGSIPADPDLNFELYMNNKIKKIFEMLRKLYPEPKTELDYSTPFQLMVAVILSAQTTDKQVNKVTK